MAGDLHSTQQAGNGNGGAERRQVLWRDPYSIAGRQVWQKPPETHMRGRPWQKTQAGGRRHKTCLKQAGPQEGGGVHPGANEIPENGRQAGAAEPGRNGKTAAGRYVAAPTGVASKYIRCVCPSI